MKNISIAEAKVVITFAKKKKVEDTTVVKGSMKLHAPMELLVSIDPVKLTATVKKSITTEVPKKQGGGPIKVGVRIMLNDGMKIQTPMADGRTIVETGDGTVLFYSYQHKTWSYTLPRVPEYKAGRPITDTNYKVLWSKPNKNTGLKLTDLRMLMRVAMQGVAQAEAAHEAKRKAA